MVVGFYADSLGLPRHGVVKLEERYIFLFEKWLRERYNEEIFVIDRARRSFTIDKLYEVYKEDLEYFTEVKDILVIHEGVCDCAPRPIPLYMRKIISSLPEFLKYRTIGFLHNNRSSLLKKGFVHYLVDKKKYRKILKEWLEDSLTQFEMIIIFNIAPTNEEIESHSPGFQQSISLYNSIIKEVVNEINSLKITLIDIHGILLNSGYPIDHLITKEDGHHLTSFAHQLYASELINAAKHLKQLSA